MRSKTTRGMLALVAAVALAMVLAACGGDDDSDTAATSNADNTSTSLAATTSTAAKKVGTIDVTTKDFSFSLGGPASVAAGEWDVHLANEGKEDHQVTIARINDGVTMEQVQAAAAKGAEHALPLLTFVGGPNTVAAGGTQDAIVDLTPGHYLFMCFVQSPSDHKAHADKGMVMPFEVTGSDAAATPAPPDDGTVTMSEYQFELPDALGQGTYKVVNEGKQPHELTIVRLADGKTVQDMEAFLSPDAPPGPPPFTSAGGAGAIAPQHTEWVSLSLPPGNYVAQCFIPDAKDGTPHFVHGMVHPFTVS